MRIILSRELGAEALGTYQIALSFFYVLATVVASGLPTTLSHLSAKYKVTNNKEAEGSAVCSSLIIGIVMSVLLTILLFALKDVIISATTTECFTIILCLSPSIIITAIYSSFRGALWGRQKHIQNCISELGEQFVRLILFMILLTTAPSPMVSAIRAGVCYSISCLVSMFISIIFYFKNGGILRSPKSTFKKVLKASFPITCLHLVSSLLQPVIAVVVPYELQCAGYTEKEAIGLFGIITGMTMPLLALPNTLIGSYATAMIPEITTSMVVKNKEELSKQIKTAITFTLFISFCFVPVYLGVGKEIGSFLFNNTTSGYLLAKASFIMVPMGISSITQSILNSVDLEFKSFKNYIFGSVVLIASILILPRFLGINAFIVGTGLSITLSSILNIRMISKYLGIKGLILKPLVLMSILVIPSSMLGNFVAGVFKCAVPQFFDVCFACAASLVSFVLLCMVFNIINVTTIFTSIKKLKNIKIMKKKTKSKA
jgi:stage V sporulation protein B